MWHEGENAGECGENAGEGRMQERMQGRMWHEGENAGENVACLLCVQQLVHTECISSGSFWVCMTPFLVRGGCLNWVLTLPLRRRERKCVSECSVECSKPLYIKRQ